MALLFPAILLIGVPLAAVPIVLHLINPRRERHVAWAAMELLIESQRRNRVWIELRGLLLLALRVLAVLGATLMLGKPSFLGSAAAWLNPTQSTHVAIIDDSYSMSDRGLDPSVWRRAIDALRVLDTRVKQQSGGRLVALRATEVMEFAAEAPLLDSRAANAEASRLDGSNVSETNVELAPVFDRLYQQLSERDAGDALYVYAFTDLRSRSVAGADDFKATMDRLAPEVDAVRIVQCAQHHSANLAVTAVTPLAGPRAVGVDVPIRVEVRNFGPSAAPEVQLRLYRDGGALPAVRIGGIPSGDARSVDTSVRFSEPGVHTVLAELDGDAVIADNRRFLPLLIPAQQTVAVVDASSDGSGSRAMRTAIDPGDGVRTGWRAELIASDAVPERLGREPPACVILADVPKLSSTAMAQLRQFVAGGGGLLVVLGPAVDRRHYNQTIFAGAESPLLDLQIGLPSQMPPGKPAGVGDLSAASHALTRAFTGDLAALSKAISVSFSHTLEVDNGGKTRVVASLWDGRPAFCLGAYGKGRVACLATHPSAELGWSSLSASPLFPIFMQDAVGYLSEPAMAPSLKTLGFGVDEVTPSQLDATGAQLMNEELLAAGGRAGVYREARSDAAAFAVNVDPREGDLELASRQNTEAIAAIDGVTLESLDAFVASVSGDPAPDVSQWFAVVVLLLLAGETIVSWTKPARASRRGYTA